MLTRTEACRRLRRLRKSSGVRDLVLEVGRHVDCRLRADGAVASIESRIAAASLHAIALRPPASLRSTATSPAAARRRRPRWRRRAGRTASEPAPGVEEEEVEREAHAKGVDARAARDQQARAGLLAVEQGETEQACAQRRPRPGPRGRARSAAGRELAKDGPRCASRARSPRSLPASLRSMDPPSPGSPSSARTRCSRSRSRR